MLERVRGEAGAGARGRHRLYLGMAPGVGKTYRGARGAAPSAGSRHRLRGRLRRDLQPAADGRGDRRPRGRPAGEVEYQGVPLEEMDLDAVIRRDPDVALVDELAHTNAPGSRHEKRWQDVDELLDHGITVISTMNVQHLESLADIVESITGVKVSERVPDSVLDEADEVELVDMTPARAAPADPARQRLPARTGRAGARALLPRGQPDRAARARPPPPLVQRRGGPPGIHGRRRHRGGLAGVRGGARRARCPGPDARPRPTGVPECRGTPCAAARGVG